MSSPTVRSKSTYSRSHVRGTRKSIPFLSLELPEEAEAALEKKPQVRDAVLDHRHPVRSHPKGETGVTLGLVADLFENGGIYHTGSKHLEPSCPFADLAVRIGAAADEAAYVQLNARLGKLEV